jgi:hypothetical protein
MPRRKTTIVSSSDGRNKEGKHMLTPDSIISYRIDDSPDIHKTQAVNRICFQMNSIWDHTIPNVTLRKELIFKHIEMDAALIRSWLKGKDDNMGALIFPGSYLNVESREPKVRIERKPDLKPSTDSIQADITMHIFRRPIDESPALQPFDPAIWHPVAYEEWKFLYTELAEAFEEYVGVSSKIKIPADASNLFHRMMHTHFADCGLIFSEKIWVDFGLGAMIGDGCTKFMSGMLTQMFMQYFTVKEDALSSAMLPPLHSAKTAAGSGQRVCAGCLSTRMGSGQMKQCPCQKVYYCCKECQKGDWKIHRLVCGVKKST